MRLPVVRYQSLRWHCALVVYALVTLVVLLLAKGEIFAGHTPYNHFSLLAEAWLEGRLALPGEPPDYAGMNDFASFRGQWFVVFPPLPALLILPFVWIAGSAEAVSDGVLWLGFAGVGPAVFFLVLEKLRAMRGIGSLARSFVFALLLAFATPYFFSAVQGSVWYVAHVVGVALLALYCLASLGATQPLVAGVALALAWMTRAPLVFAAPLFVLEAYHRARSQLDERTEPQSRSLIACHWPTLFRLVVPFAFPLVLAGAVALVYNSARFGDPLEPGYRYLAVRWHERIITWGLFSYHYLGKNLGVLFTSLPWLGSGHEAPFRVNGHGLALWLTSPIFLWLGCRSRSRRLASVLLISAGCVAVPTLFYQNTGWLQFAYRFANDYAILLLTVLYVSRVAHRKLFAAAACWSVAVNFFGAMSFGRQEWQHYYFIDGTQRILYEPD